MGRFFKPLLVAFITFWALDRLTGDGAVALTLAAVPLLLGWVNILTGPVYTASALAFILAAYVQVAPALNWPHGLSQLQPAVTRLVSGTMAELRPPSPSSLPSPAGPDR